MLACIRLEDEKLGEKICEQLRTIGFFVLEIPETEALQQLQLVSERFFAQPVAEKKKVAMLNYRGYSGLGEEVTLKQRDWHETLDFIPDLREEEKLGGENQYPNENYRNAVKDYYRTMNDVGLQIMKSIAATLGRHIIDEEEEPFSLLRVLNYPPIPESNVETECNNEYEIGEGIGLHTDYGFLSIIHSTTDGLQVQDLNGEFINVKCESSSQFCVNIGDAFARLVPEFRATPHRVVHAEERMSIAFFFEPHYNQMIPDNNGGESFKYGDYLFGMYKRSYPSQ